MPSIQFGTSSYKRGRGDLPALPVINMFVEEAPTEETGIALQSRPGLEDRAANMGDGPVRQLFRADNVLGTNLFGVSGPGFYRNDTLVGAIDGDGPVSMAGYENLLFMAAGGQLWGYDGTTLEPIAFPDDANVTRVIVGGSRIIAIRADTGAFYWSTPLGDTIEALNFATAEAQPDRLLHHEFIDGILVLFGAETVEFHPLTGDANLPFQTLQARVIERGIKGTGCGCSYGSTFAWVTNVNQVCVSDERTVISNPGLEERIAASTTCNLFTFMISGTEYLCLRIDGETQVWSQRSGRWSEFKSYGFANWVPQCQSSGVFGSAYDGRTMQWSSAWTDLGGVLERRFRGGFPINSAGLKVNTVQIRCNIGQAINLTGLYSEPVVEMRTTRDAGKTWGSYKPVSLGRQGEYRTRAQWRACGMASYPAFLAEWRCTDPVDFRVSDVRLNDPRGGR